jgi:signal transduction histidine kinase
MNAIQIHRQAGTPEPTIRVEIVREDGAIRIDVADNGPGIDPDHVGQLFDGFFTTRADGLGLGLSICRTILAAHGGSIAVPSRSGQPGATFSVQLPL